jgi:rhodanese-related sulfurtransferase
MSSTQQGEATEPLDVDPETVSRWLDEAPDVQVIDVREDFEHEAGHIAGTRLIGLAQLSGEAQTIDRERPVVFYCRTGSRSTMAAQAFRGAGFQAYSMDGGLVRWVREGRPLAPQGGTVANH